MDVLNDLHLRQLDLFKPTPDEDDPLEQEALDFFYFFNRWAEHAAGWLRFCWLIP